MRVPLPRQWGLCNTRHEDWILNEEICGFHRGRGQRRLLENCVPVGCHWAEDKESSFGFSLDEQAVGRSRQCQWPPSFLVQRAHIQASGGGICFAACWVTMHPWQGYPVYLPSPSPLSIMVSRWLRTGKIPQALDITEHY